MIELHPIPDVLYYCPFDSTRLEQIGWYIPGMRMLADLSCPNCERQFYGDLPAGHGLLYPMLLEKESGRVTDDSGAAWFAKWLEDSYQNRSEQPVPFRVDEFHVIKKPLLLNCLDTLYGHSLLKLLNAQYYLDNCPSFDLILLVPTLLRWMVPDGVAAVWTVDIPLRQGKQWNDWLATEIKRRILKYDACWLSVAFPHPRPVDFDIQRFTQVVPFPTDEWSLRLSSPTITFIWREDRLWSDTKIFGTGIHFQHVLRRKLGKSMQKIDIQNQAVIALAQRLRNVFPKLNFAIAGLGERRMLPDWIADMRYNQINETIERSWCRRYANSHVIVGVHGSNMLLPSAHAGAVIELMPTKRWPNMLQDLLLPVRDSRELLYSYRTLPIQTNIEKLAVIIASLLTDYATMILTMTPMNCDHDLFSTMPKVNSLDSRA